MSDMITTKELFVGELTIGQLGSTYVADNLQELINKYEPKFMILCLGDKTYEALQAGLDENPIPEEWEQLKKKLLLPCASYVYCYYMQDSHSDTTGQGEVLPEVENGSLVSSCSKIIRAWNEMSKGVGEVQRFLLQHPTNYPDYVFKQSELNEPKNLFGL